MFLHATSNSFYPELIFPPIAYNSSPTISSNDHARTTVSNYLLARYTTPDEALPLNPQVQVDPQVNTQPLLYTNMIGEAIRWYFGVQLKPLKRHVYRKPYLN